MSGAVEMAQSPLVVLLSAGRAHTTKSAKDTLAAFDQPEAAVDTLTELGLLSSTGGELRVLEPLRQAALLTGRKAAGTAWMAYQGFYLDMALDRTALERPHYMRSGVGVAYHGAELSSEVGLASYLRIAHEEPIAIAIEGTRTAGEQERRGVLPAEAPELIFLHAMTEYRAGLRESAVERFRKIVDLENPEREVAIAQHLVARSDCQTGGDQQEIKRLFASSLASGKRRDDVFHQVHVMHSMAACIVSRRNPRLREARALLTEALTMIDDEPWQRAQLLHTLGRLDGKRGLSVARSELEESAKLGRELGRMWHVQAVERTLDGL